MSESEFVKSFSCECQRLHDALVDEYIAKSGAIGELWKYVKKTTHKKHLYWRT